MSYGDETDLNGFISQKKVVRVFFIDTHGFERKKTTFFLFNTFYAITVIYLVLLLIYILTEKGKVIDMFLNRDVFFGCSGK